MIRFYDIPTSLSTEIDELESLIGKFRAGKLEAAKFRAYRVPFGIYEQRTAETYMVRIRCTGGGITPEQLKTVALLSQQYGGEKIHLTTRQEVQIHDVSLVDIPVILRALLTVHLSTRGGGGNTVRNIMVSWDAGIAPDEPFDVTPYAISLTSMLIAEPDSWTLPRKYKIAFSNSPQDSASSAFTDLGFMAVKQGDNRGFRVYVAGGLGSKPQVGHVLHPFIPADQVYRVAAAVKMVFDRHGNRKNKRAARLRFLWNKLGEAKFRELYEEAAREIGDVPLLNLPEMKNEAVDLTLCVPENSPEFDLWKRRFVLPQKQPGLSSILVPVPLGQLPCHQAIILAELPATGGANVLRLTRDQNLTIRNISEQYLGNVFRLVKDFSFLSAAPKLHGNSIACTGANTCRLGICLPRGGLTALNKNLLKSGLDLDSLGDFRLNISGCPNTCGAHMTADLGFYGQVGRQGQRLYPAYVVVAGAQVGGETPRLATRMDTISARDLPDFVLKFLSVYQGKKDNYLNFTQYIDGEGKCDIQEICDRYRKIPDFEDDKNYYYDWGAEEIFSLVGKGVGECSAGLFDLIELDLQEIKVRQKEWESQSDPAATGGILYQIVLSAARMLLVTRGVEAHSDTEVFDAFIKYFIELNLIEKRFLPLLQAATGRHAALLTTMAGDVHALARAVEKLYEGMDDSLKFQAELETADLTATAKGATGGPATQEQLLKDLRGVACPMNFVKTKMELAKLTSGQLLRIFLDDGEPIDNVPRSVAEEGHKIAELAKVGDYWSVLIEKR